MILKSVGNDVQAGGNVTSRPPEVLGMKISEMRISKAKSKEKFFRKAIAETLLGALHSLRWSNR